MLLLAAAGFVVLALRTRHALVTLLVAFGPYLIFDLLFQETITTRYALPLVIPMAFLAVRGAAVLPRPAAIGVTCALIAGGAYISDGAMYGFATMDAPAFRMLADMQVAVKPDGAALPTTPVLAMHRRELLRHAAAVRSGWVTGCRRSHSASPRRPSTSGSRW